MVNKIGLNAQYLETKASQSKPELPAQGEVKELEKSIYNSKGSNVYFCGLVRGLSQFEEVIADGFRSFMENGKRKFNEHDIRDIMDAVKKAKTPEEKRFMLDATAALLDVESKIKLDDKVVKNVMNSVDNADVKKALKAIEQRPEEECYAILDFANYEFRNATDPLTSFINLPKSTQDEMVLFLQKIKAVGDGSPMSTSELSVEASDNLYDLFKVVMYAHEDLPKLNPAERQKYLLEQLDVIGGDIRSAMKNYEIEAPETRKQIVDLEKEMLYYFTDKFVVSGV